MAPPVLHIDPSLSPCPARTALVWAEGIPPSEPSSELFPWLADLVAKAAADSENAWPEGRRKAVRDMLRHGRYKPSGRAKPASELLLRFAADDDFPAVSPLVDVNNAVSLASGLPASVFDADLTGDELLLRRGAAGESYVFNQAGHEIALEDLLLVCRREGDDWVPCGNPVKDSMATKVGSQTTRAVAVIYAPATIDAEELAGWAERYAALLRDHCGATAAGTGANH